MKKIKNSEVRKMSEIKLTKRGQAIAEMGKQRHTVKPFNYRLYKYSVNNEVVGCKLVNMTEIHPTKEYWNFIRV